MTENKDNLPSISDTDSQDLINKIHLNFGDYDSTNDIWSGKRLIEAFVTDDNDFNNYVFIYSVPSSSFFA